MSLTLTLSGRSSILAASYFPPLELSDDDYELGLATFETYNTIPNVNSSNNKFYFDVDDDVIAIPEGPYELRAINAYLKAAILRKRRRAKGEADDGDEYIRDDEKGERSIVLRG